MSIPNTLKNNLEVANLILFTAEVHHDIVYEDNNKHVEVLLEHHVSEVYKSCRRTS